MSASAAAPVARPLLPFAAFSASYFAHIGFFNPYLSLWLNELGIGLLAIGLLTSVQAATRLFAPYAWGALSDRTGERVRLLRLGAGLAFVASFGFWIDAGVWWLALVLLITFTNTSAMMPMSEAALALLVSNAGVFDVRRYGRVRMWGSFGFLVTVMLAGAWFDRFGMRFFPVATTLTLAGVLLCAWRLPDTREHSHAPTASVSVWPVLRQPQVRWFFAAVFFHILSHMGVYIYLSLYLDASGHDKTVIGLLWAVSVVAEIGWFYWQGRWLPRLPLLVWLVVCGLVTALRMGVTAAGAGVLLLMALAQIAHAFTFAAHHASCIALLARHFPGRLRGRGQALYTVIGYGLPGVLAGLFGGLLSSRLGLPSVFWACMVMALVAAACALRAVQMDRDPAVSPPRSPATG